MLIEDGEGEEEDEEFEEEEEEEVVVEEEGLGRSSHAAPNPPTTSTSHISDKMRMRERGQDNFTEPMRPPTNTTPSEKDIWW